MSERVELCVGVAGVTEHVVMPLDPLVEDPLVPEDHGTAEVLHGLVRPAPGVDSVPDQGGPEPGRGGEAEEREALRKFDSPPPRERAIIFGIWFDFESCHHRHLCKRADNWEGYKAGDQKSSSTKGKGQKKATGTMR